MSIRRARPDAYGVSGASDGARLCDKKDIASDGARLCDKWVGRLVHSSTFLGVVVSLVCVGS